MRRLLFLTFAPTLLHVLLFGVPTTNSSVRVGKTEDTVFVNSVAVARIYSCCCCCCCCCCCLRQCACFLFFFHGLVLLDGEWLRQVVLKPHSYRKASCSKSFMVNGWCRKASWWMADAGHVGSKKALHVQKASWWMTGQIFGRWHFGVTEKAAFQMGWPWFWVIKNVSVVPMVTRRVTRTYFLSMNGTAN